jgi:tuftelin-interacting protein 11
MSDDEDEKAAKQKNRRGRGGSPSQRDAAWKQPKRERKPKTEFRSYEEILAATGDTQAVDGGLGQIVDLTGAEVRSALRLCVCTSLLSSSAQLPSLAATLTISGQPVFDDSRLPELRHNLRLITDTAKGELDALAREAKAGAEKRRWLVAERTRTETRVGSESARIGRLKAILADVEELVLLSKASVKAASTTLPTQRLATFDGVIDRLLSMEDYAEYELDEAVVAALAPCVRRVRMHLRCDPLAETKAQLRQAWAGWDPLDNPKYLVAQLDQWRKAFRIPKASADMDDIYAARTTKTKCDHPRLSATAL